MKILLKAMETEEDLTRFMNFCEAHGIGMIARNNGTSLSLDMIKFEMGGRGDRRAGQEWGLRGSINWGGLRKWVQRRAEPVQLLQVGTPGG